MTAMIELRDRLKAFAGVYEMYILGVVKAIAAFVIFNCINSEIGYMEKLNSVTLVLVMSLVASLLPVDFISIAAALLVTLHLYALSPAVAVVGLCIFIVMYLIYFRFTPGRGYFAVITPVAYIWHVPCVMPFVAGYMDKSPTSGIPVLCGTVIYYFLKGVKDNSVNLSTMEERDSLVSKVSDTVSQFLGNRELATMACVMLLASVVVWFIRRLKVDYAWYIAFAVGATIELVGMILGNIRFSLGISFLGMLLQIIVSAAVSFVLMFFFFNLDYERTERVQFEDDEYYYFVKAVPKVYVARGQKKVKKYAENVTKDDVIKDFEEE